MLLNPHPLTVLQMGESFTLSGAMLKDENILVTNMDFLKKMLVKTSLNHMDYAGSFWRRQNAVKKNVNILCLPPLEHLYKTKPGVFLFRRFLDKILNPTKLFQPSPFEWTLCNDLLSWSSAFDYCNSCDLLAVDIETSPFYENREEELNPRHVILSVSYSAVRFDSSGDSFTCRTFVLPIKSTEAVKWMRKLNATEAPKIFQNGKYDNFYFLRYQAPVKNWCFDTMDAHHALYSELPKNLGYISAFYLRETSFWKDEGKTGNIYDLYQYNGKDTWGTANTFLAWIREAPDWAINNYVIKFGLNFPCLACEVDGLVINQERLTVCKIEQKEKQERKLSSIRKILGYPTFNPSSPKQVLSILKALGNTDLKSSGEKYLEIAGDRHPFSRRIVDEIKDYREASKLISTYLDATLWRGKLLYTLNPSATDTARLASKESQLWCGTQIQNIPPYFKTTIYADDGYNLGEGDNRQSESRCTAYLSGDENLIATVESDKDFHANNASKFFGLSYQQILDEEKKAKLETFKPFTIRDLSKRVNHGATYNMMEGVLLLTMGHKNVLKAQILLGLPKDWSPLDVCRYLLEENFHKTYPGIRKDFYEHIKACIKSTKLLVSPLGWTRYCFGNPSKSKPDLNSYIAHPPSNLSVGIINEAFEDIYFKIQVKSNGAFRLKAQIHDSILFQYKIGRLDLVEEAWHLMQRPKVIRDCKGKTRTMLIPVDMKGEETCWTRLKEISFK